MRAANCLTSCRSPVNFRSGQARDYGAECYYQYIHRECGQGIRTRRGGTYRRQVKSRTKSFSLTCQRCLYERALSTNSTRHHQRIDDESALRLAQNHQRFKSNSTTSSRRP